MSMTSQENVNASGTISSQQYFDPSGTVCVMSQQYFDPSGTMCMTSQEYVNPSGADEIEALKMRLRQYENKAAYDEYQMELEKQRSMKNNLSIFGIVQSDNENLLQIALAVFNEIGCIVTEDQVAECYRIRTSSNNIIIVKFNDYALKQQILKDKVKKEVKVGEVTPNCSPDDADTTIYINNHVTPFFGKLLQEGRKCVKSGDLHSCWISSYGCQLKFEENGSKHNYRSVDELRRLIADKRLKSLKRSAPDNWSPTSNKHKKCDDVHLAAHE